MRLLLRSLFFLALACRGLAQDIQPPKIDPYTGPTIAYPGTSIAFAVCANGQQPGVIANDLEYEILTTPTNTVFSTFYDRDGYCLFVHWQTPPRSAVGTTNQFVIKITDQGTPPLSATNLISFVLTDLPPIRSIAKSNSVIVLQIADLLPGMPYSVQWADAVPSTNWSVLVSFSPASPSIAITDRNPRAAQRFYRLWSTGWCYGVHCP